MKFPLCSPRFSCKNFALFGCALLSLGNALHAAPTKKAPAQKAETKTNVPAIFYDEMWSYRIATLYDAKKNIVSSVSGEAKFNRDGTYEQNYYIGTIGNFFKGKFKLNGDNLTTYDEKGEKIFDYKLSIGTAPKTLVMSIFNDDGSKSMDFSLVPLEKNP